LNDTFCLPNTLIGSIGRNARNFRKIFGKKSCVTFSEKTTHKNEAHEKYVFGD